MRKSSQKTLVFVVFAFAGTLLNAQQQPGGEESSSTSEPGKSQREAVINLSGTVIQEDGTAPPGMVRVEMVCDGTVREQVLLDAGGNFSIQFGGKTHSTWVDASTTVSRDPDMNAWLERGSTPPQEGEGPAPEVFTDMRNTGLGQMNLSGCEIRTQYIAGFRSDPIPLGPRSVFDNPDVGVIILQSTHRDPTMTTNVITLAAPPEAVKAYGQARKEMLKSGSDFLSARAELEKAVDIYPEFVQAWYLLGNACLRLKDPAAARVSFEKAISLDDSFTEPYLQLADLEITEEKFGRAAELTGHVKELKPDLPGNRYLDGLANYFLSRLDVAEDSFRFLDRGGHGESYPLTYCYIGLIEAQDGALETAIRRVEECMELAPENVLPQEQRAELRGQVGIWERRLERKASRALPSDGLPNRDPDGARILSLGERGIDIEYKDHPGGILISNVKWYGAAWSAGLRPGDIVVTVNGEQPDKEIFGRLFREIFHGETDQGDFTVWRDGEELTFRAKRAQSQQ